MTAPPRALAMGATAASAIRLAPPDTIIDARLQPTAHLCLQSLAALSVMGTSFICRMTAATTAASTALHPCHPRTSVLAASAAAANSTTNGATAKVLAMAAAAEAVGEEAEAAATKVSSMLT